MRFPIPLVIGLVTSLMLIGCSDSSDNITSSESKESQSQQSNANHDDSDSQLESYYKDFPYQDTYNYFATYTDKNPAKINKWVLGVEPKLVVAGEDTVVRMNNDTYYKMAFIHLAKGPVLLGSSTVDNNRFSSFQLMDDHNVNFKNIIHPEGEFTLYYGDKPSEIKGEAVESPSELMVVIVRVEVKDKDDESDTSAAKAVINGITITGPEYTEFPQLDLLSKYDETLVTEANKKMDEVGRNTPFIKLVAGPNYVPKRVSYLQLAAGTKGGWGGPITSHSAYETKFADADNNDLDGSKGTYTVTIEEPPVDAFWSITVYDTERGGFLHPNKHNRYHINNTAAEKNEDGTVTFLFKQRCDETDKNCLEVPAGKFDLATRYYLPEESIQTGEWTFPEIELK